MGNIVPIVLIALILLAVRIIGQFIAEEIVSKTATIVGFLIILFLAVLAAIFPQYEEVLLTIYGFVLIPLLIGIGSAVWNSIKGK